MKSSKKPVILESKYQLKLLNIQKDILVFNNYENILILSCSSINLTLMNESTQAHILKSYEDFLNSLEEPLEIFIQIRLKDNPSHLIESISKQFYIILRKNLKTATSNLHQQAQTIIAYFKRLNLKVDILNLKQSLQLLYDQLNFKEDFKITSTNIKNRLAYNHLISYKSLIEKPSYLRANHSFYQVYTITSYPLETDFNFLDELINIQSNLNISYHIKPFDNNLALSKLNRKIAELQSSEYQAVKKGQIVSPQISDPLNSALELRGKLSRSQTRLFGLQITVVSLSQTRDQMMKTFNDLKALLRSQLFNLEIASYEQLPLFEASLPLSSNLKHLTWRNFDSQSLSLSFPFKDGQILHKKGILYGRNKLSNALVVIDRFSLPNANSVIFAQSGAGKSYLMKLEIIRYLDKGVKIIVLDPEAEYLNLVKNYNGQIINLKDLKNLNLNPLYVGDNIDPINNLSEIINLIEIMVGGLKQDQIHILDKILIHLYKTRKNPTLKDLYKLLKDSSENSLCQKLYKFCYGSQAHIFDQQASSFNLEHQLTVISLPQADSDLKALMMILIINHLQKQIFNDPLPRILVIDEAWLLLQDNKASSFIEQLVRRARKYYLGVSLISQQATDFYINNQASALITQASLKILLRQDSTQLKMLSQEFSLNDYETKFLLSSSIGEALIIYDKQHVITQIIAHKNEHPLITTNPQELYLNEKNND